MKKLSISLFEPVPNLEVQALEAYVHLRVPNTFSTPEERVRWATATQALLRRGMLLKTKDGLVVTPEGLALILDTAPLTGLDSSIVDSPRVIE